MNNILIIFTIFILAALGCMPEQAMRAPSTTQSNATSGDSSIGSNTNTTPSAINETTKWYDNGSLKTVLTIDENNTKNIYVFGDDISIFLDTTESYNADYCAFINFQSTLDKTPKQLRVRLIPQVTFNAQTGKQSKYFRVNINTATGNDICNISSFKEDKVTSDTYSSLTATNAVNQICTDCINFITSTSVVFYRFYPPSTTAPDSTIYSNGFLKQVPSDQLQYADLILRVDMSNNSENNTPTCNNNDCQAQGYDCCLNGQCVIDGGLKNERPVVAQIASQINDPSFLTEFDYAESQKIINPLLYLQYPQYYYICLENTPDSGDDNSLDPVDPAGDARQRLIEMISDFYCIEELKNNSVSNPFHNDPFNNSSTYQACAISASTNTDPSMYYQEVMKRMYENCGCAETTYNEMVANCPKYTYQAIYQTGLDEYPLSSAYTLMTQRNVTTLQLILDLPEVTGIDQVECVSPEVDPNIPPFQNMNVIVNSKTAPHRFFDQNTSSGESLEITDVNTLPSGASGVQEGDAFQYLDNEKLFPLNGSFNMNSILGQMTIDLSLAKPAKIIDLDFDKMYYIATIEGYYTPCPSCAKDSWFSNFSPHPNSSQGVGLQSIGYTTRRDSWGSNTTLGNYEDTIFGRACWLPPTMIPFSHLESADQQTQRLNRLKTQAAYFINGYQRDWFGFNKGALIGSFDGVSWFAIGKGRVVKSTTNKLYLAINAPFADLAQYNDHIVSVQEWDFITTGPQYDYHPDEAINSVYQNEAGLCQKNHSCTTDSDCITQLGWEYSCVDVNQYTTKWPQFSPTGAIEVANASQEGTIISFLAQAELPPGTSSKKCVYRGAGAPCRIDYDQITDSEKRKSLACAPNFYCAPLSSNNVFNKEVARYASVLEDISGPKNHYFGQDANQLGRPKDYISTGNLYQLPSATQTTINSNLTTIDSSGAGDFGLCRPGKSLPDYNSVTSTLNYDQIDQQKQADPEFRTDFISQISGCNSALFTRSRYSSCPMLGSDGNYLHLSDAYLNNQVEHQGYTLDREIASVVYGHSQNSCGLEVLNSTATIGYGISANTLSQYSAFSSIEAKPLSSSSVHFESTLVRDACYRKAGSVCHTDLDCSPNYKHADLIDILNPTYFGNEAEKKYWQESLICGQGSKQPLVPGSPDFNSYDITKNRCCREVGNDITMYTEDSPEAPESLGLQTHTFGGYFPNNPNRYSRYSNLDYHGMQSSSTPDSLFIRPTANSEVDVNGLLLNANNIIDNKKQWKTLHGSAKRTCCGGGWIRKFADGTNNWSINRLNLDVTNFRCLNFNTPLVNIDDPTPFGLTSAQNNLDSQNLCFDSNKTAANCAQQPFGTLANNQVQKPILNNNQAKMKLYSHPAKMTDDWPSEPWSFFIPFSSDESALTYLDWDKDINDVERRNISVQLPSFITWADPNDNIENHVTVSLQVPRDPGFSSSEYHQCQRIPINTTDCGADSNAWNGLCGATSPVLNASTQWDTACPSNGNYTKCCYMYDPASRILKVAHNWDVVSNDSVLVSSNFNQAADGVYKWKQLGMKLEFIAPGTLRWEQEYTSTNTVSDYNVLDSLGNEIINHRRSAEAGNALYYLKRLENLELLGIPQISYMPLYCNDNYQKLVPGLFKSSYNNAPLTNIIEFITHPNTFKATATSSPTATEATPFASDSAATPYNADSLNEPRLTTQELINHEPIFSDHDFMCCSPLGTELDQGDMGKCCSGYAVAADSSGNNSSSKVICKLPPYTDINVYFNKFVSSEGMSENIQAPLVEDDFDSHTGYPKLNTSVIQKLQVLASQYCESGSYTRGGAFGDFVAEPHGTMGKQNGPDANRVYSLIDSVYDESSNNNVTAGFDPFSMGFRWNHHFYCNPGGSP